MIRILSRQGTVHCFARIPVSLQTINLSKAHLSSGGPSPLLPVGWTPSTIKEANDWVIDFKKRKSLSKQDVEISYARSSGPGGQVGYSNLLSTVTIDSLYTKSNNHYLRNILVLKHVNKVNSKAVVKLPLDSVMIPSWAKDRLRNSVRTVFIKR